MTSRSNSAGLRRDLELLQVLGSPAALERGGLGVVRIAQLAGREKSQVSRALLTLLDAGLVDRDPDTQSYRLGWRLFVLGAQTVEAQLKAVGEPYLHQVCAMVQETTHLCVLRGLDVVTLATQSQQHAFRAMWVGVPAAAHVTSAGRVLISEWPDEAIRAVFTPQRLAMSIGHCALTTTEELLEELERIRSQGYAVVDEEFDFGVVGCSAPVRDVCGRIVAAINVGAPKTRLGDKLDAAGIVTAKAATQMSKALAHKTPRNGGQ